MTQAEQGRAMNVQGIVIAAFLALTAASGAAKDLAAMGPEEVTALQRRLADAGCYKGAIDGTPSQATEAAVKACPVMDPILSIETGMHTAVINRIGVERQCRLLATGSDDKTARLWSLPEGRLLKTLRPPIGAGHNGKVYAVAVSPDGGLVAAGGWGEGRGPRGGCEAPCARGSAPAPMARSMRSRSRRTAGWWLLVDGMGAGR